MAIVFIVVTVTVGLVEDVNVIVVAMLLLLLGTSYQAHKINSKMYW